jgi:hypothetical protein
MELSNSIISFRFSCTNPTASGGLAPDLRKVQDWISTRFTSIKACPAIGVAVNTLPRGHYWARQPLLNPVPNWKSLANDEK